ncbi:MAG: hypothetical protein JXB85_16650 [Anaerolineales bacterium]|nr:hypothetical protein [Anaerolineales bacterium]
MSLDAAINDLKDKITAAGKTAAVKVVKMSAEEARISVFATAAEMQAIRDATFQPVLDYLTSDGLDIQVLVYDRDNPPEIG